MSETPDRALLPPGLRDVLPPEAAFEATMVARVLATFAAFGYERVKPPLLEFEDSLLAESGVAMAADTFRLMDPASQRMMGLRADMTLQVARIAATRLKRRARPLRLSYAGQVLRVKGGQIRSERQFGQVGVELIGAATVAADAEVVLMGLEALDDLGIRGLSVDLGMPTLVPAVLAAHAPTDDVRARLRLAFDRKDASAVRAHGEKLGRDAAGTLDALLAAAGPAEEALERLSRLSLPPAAAAAREGLAAVAARLRDGAAALGLADLHLTVDPVENRGFEYHTGATFTYFAAGVRGEIGRGGRYLAGNSGTDSESATGLTFFTDALLAAVPLPDAERRVFLPVATPAAARRQLRAEGWITLAGLDERVAPEVEARRLGCSHILVNGRVVPLDNH